MMKIRYFRLVIELRFANSHRDVKYRTRWSFIPLALRFHRHLFPRVTPFILYLCKVTQSAICRRSVFELGIEYAGQYLDLNTL